MIKLVKLLEYKGNNILKKIKTLDSMDFNAFNTHTSKHSWLNLKSSLVFNMVKVLMLIILKEVFPSTNSLNLFIIASKKFYVGHGGENQPPRLSTHGSKHDRVAC